MEFSSQEDLKAHLMATNEEFRHLVAQHTDYDRQIASIEGLPHVTPEAEIEEHRLKKLKLHIKDQITEVLSRYRTQQVS